MHYDVLRRSATFYDMHQPRIKVDGPGVRRVRMLQGLEIADVAARVGISRSYLSRIEVNSLPLRPRTYRALHRALNCDDTELLAPGEPDSKEEECPSDPPSPS